MNLPMNTLAIVLIVFGFLSIYMYAMCRAAGMADQQGEVMFEEWKHTHEMKKEDWVKQPNPPGEEMEPGRIPQGCE